VLDSVRPLEKLEDALLKAESGKTRGKIAFEIKMWTVRTRSFVCYLIVCELHLCNVIVWHISRPQMRNDLAS